ncbi:MAG: hypothetical protein Tsb002_34490 [Wenzhouxiangellaceae bacterium]
MARPRKPPAEQRTRVLSVRLTADEYDRVVAMARDAGMLAGPYARATILNRRPRSKPAANLVFQRFLYELQSIATNFKQLADATGDARYLKWARHVGGHLVEILIGRDDLSGLIEQQFEPVNTAGHQINRLAHAANTGSRMSAEDLRDAIGALKSALAPLEQAAGQPPTEPPADQG